MCRGQPPLRNAHTSELSHANYTSLPLFSHLPPLHCYLQATIILSHIHATFYYFFYFLLLFSSIVCLLGWLFFLLLIRKCSVCNGISMQWKVFHRVSKISPRLKDTDNARKKPKKVLQVMTGCECLVHFSSDVLLGSKMQMQKLVGSQLLQIFLEMSKT